MKSCPAGRWGRSAWVVLSVVVLAVMFLYTDSPGRSFPDITIVKILPGEQMAVVRFDRYPLQVVRVGDMPVRGYRVLEIGHNRIVIQVDTGAAPEKIIIRLKDGEQYLERVMSVPDGSGRSGKEVRSLAPERAVQN